MASNFPGAVDSFRAVQNRPSRQYNPDETTVLFAEDQNNHSDAIRATQQYIKDNDAKWSAGGGAPVLQKLVIGENDFSSPDADNIKHFSVPENTNYIQLFNYDLDWAGGIYQLDFSDPTGGTEIPFLLENMTQQSNIPTNNFQAFYTTGDEVYTWGSLAEIGALPWYMIPRQLGYVWAALHGSQLN